MSARARITRSNTELEALVSARVIEARAAWPTVHVDEEAFFEAVAEHLRRFTEDGGDEARALPTLHFSDLWLAHACAAGDTKAIELFERRVMPDALAALHKMAGMRAHLDEAAQLVRMRLLLGDDGAPPKIATYSGRGPLGAFVRVAAVRTALSLARKTAVDPASPDGDDALAETAAPAETPEIAHLRAKHAAEFRAAFHEALVALSPEQRNVLRLHLLDGLNIDQIGLIHQVHRATVARWLARARETVRDDTRRRLAAKIAVDGPELESIVTALHSQLDVSVQRILRELG